LTTKKFRTVFDEVKNVLPNGASPAQLIEGNVGAFGMWTLAPQVPSDLFATIGMICSVSGAIGYFNPDPEYAVHPAKFGLTVEERKYMIRVGSVWGGAPDPGLKESDCCPLDANREVQSLWTEFLNFKNQPLRIKGLLEGDFDKWWCKAAFKLLIVADIASMNIGQVDGNGGSNPFTDVILSHYQGEAGDDEAKKAIPGSNLLRHERFPASLTIMADKDVVCVQPKSRISQVGCTLRNLSANLALLPPQGMVRCHWSQTAALPKGDDDDALDILLVPLPFKLNGKNFEPTRKDIDVCDASRARPNWDNFEVHQDWLDDHDQIVADIKKLLKEAQKQTRTINGIVLPEYALNWRTFEKLCDTVFEDEPGLEFLISGSSSNCASNGTSEPVQKANYVLTAVNFDPGEKIAENRRTHVASRKKHHRWRLDRNQISDYALASILNPSVKAWWEEHSIETRELYFHQFRQSSTFVTMICEDLARNDPCHEILRSTGPNLLFALLMDGPQLPQRWSARYAASLADDPGSAVLTLTSFGLIDRLNKTGKFDESRTIALWKDGSGRIQEIYMPRHEGPCGVLVSLSSLLVTDQTIDGRQKRSRSWRFYSQQPVIPTTY